MQSGRGFQNPLREVSNSTQSPSVRKVAHGFRSEIQGAPILPAPNVSPGSLTHHLGSHVPCEIEPVTPKSKRWRPIPPQFLPYRDLGQHSPNMPVCISPIQPAVYQKPVVVEEAQSNISTQIDGCKYIDSEFDNILVESIDEIEKGIGESKLCMRPGGTSTSTATNFHSVVSNSNQDIVAVSTAPTSATVLPSSTPAIGPSSSAATGVMLSQMKTFNLNIMNVRDFQEVWKVLQGE